MIALALASEIIELGGDVVGKAASVDTALDAIATTDLDGAIVDIRLGRQRTFRVADAPLARQIPFVFATATPPKIAPARYASIPWFEKPYRCEAVCDALVVTLTLTLRRAYMEARIAGWNRYVWNPNDYYFLDGEHMVGRICLEVIHGERKWHWFLQTEPAPPPNSGVCDSLKEAKAGFKRRYAEVRGK